MRVRMPGLRGPRYLTKVKLSGASAPDREGKRRRFMCVTDTGANEVGGSGRKHAEGNAGVAQGIHKVSDGSVSAGYNDTII